MKINWNKKYTTIAIYALGVVAIATLVLVVLLNLGTIGKGVSKFVSIINPLIIGFIIAYLVNPMMKVFEKRVFAFCDKGKKRPALKRVLSIVLSYLVYITFIMLIFALLIPQLLVSCNDLINMLSGALSTVDSTADMLTKYLPFLDADRTAQYIEEFFADSYKIVQTVTPHLTSFVASFAEYVKNAFLGIILSIYFLYSKEKLIAQGKKLVYAILPEKKSDSLMDFLRFTDGTFGGFIIGKLLDSLIICIITFVVLAIFNIPYYSLVAIIVGVTNIIPFFGPFIGAIPSAFIILIADPIKALWFLVIILIIQQIDGNVIGPKILGETVGLSSLGVIVAITVMSGLFGVVGMFIGVPLFALIYVMAKRFVKRMADKKMQGEAVEAEEGSDEV